MGNSAARMHGVTAGAEDHDHHQKIVHIVKAKNGMD